jgi:hypothetical protein
MCDGLLLAKCSVSGLFTRSQTNFCNYMQGNIKSKWKLNVVIDLYIYTYFVNSLSPRSIRN